MPSAVFSTSSMCERKGALQACVDTPELSAEQMRKKTELQNSVHDLLPIDDSQKISDSDLIFRFLVGRGWNVEAADASLRMYVNVRREQNLNSIIAEKLDPSIESTAALLYGLDRDGCPIMWNTPDASVIVTLVKSNKIDSLLRLQIRVIETARFLARMQQRSRCTLVLDLSHVSISSVNSMTLTFLRQLCKIMQDYYPEIMNRILIFNAGWAVTGAWKVLRPFVDPRVQKKILFFTGSLTVDSIAPFVSADQVPPSLRRKVGGADDGSSSSNNGGSSSTPNMAEEMIQAEVERLRRGSSMTKLRHRVVPSPIHMDPASLRVSSHGNPKTSSCSRTVSQMQESPRQGVSQEIPMVEDDTAEELYSFCSSVSSNGGGSSMFPKVQIGSPEALDLPCDKHKMAYSNITGLPAQKEAWEDKQAIHLTECINGKVMGFCKQVLIGEMEHNIVYRGDTDIVRDMLFPPSSLFSDMQRQRIMVGELLSEAGHRIHHCVIVCGAKREALYVLRKGRIRRRVRVYQMMDDARVVTDSLLRHSVVGEKVRLAECVPHSKAVDDQAAWMMVMAGAGEHGDKVCCAEKMGQTLIAHGFLAKKALAEIFTLLMGICRLWEADIHPVTHAVSGGLLRVRSVLGMHT